VPQLGTHYVDPGAEVVEASTQPPVAFVARVDRGKQLSRRLLRASVGGFALAATTSLRP